MNRFYVYGAGALLASGCVGEAPLPGEPGVEDADTAELAQGLIQCSKISLRTHNGRYLVAEGGGNRELAATRIAAREWETFRVIQLGGNKIGLRAHDGHYLSAEGGGGGVVNANRDWLREWETFTVVHLGGRKIGLQSYNGKFVTAEGGGGGAVNANRDWLREWETFVYSCV